MENNSFIPPDYSEAKEQEFPHDPMIDENDLDDLDDQDIDIEDEDDDEIAVTAKEDFEVKAVEQQKQENERIAMTTTPSVPFGSPGNTSPFGAPTQSPWGNQNNNPGVWGSGGFSRPQSQPWGGSSTPTWQTPSTPGFGAVGGQRAQIDRAKKIIFCDFIDGAVEAYGANGKPGLRPRDVYDLRPRFEVWDKLAAFNPERIFFVIPASLIPTSANGIDAWNVTLSYFCCSISSYLRIPYENCQILKQNHIGQNKADVFRAVLEKGFNKEDAVVVGIYSGGPGLSNVDQVAASECGIDYVDLNTLLNSMI